MANQVNCLVIGVDYGTTYTGVAYRALTFEPIGSGKIKPSAISTVTAWPGIGNENKVPSEMSYATGPGGEHQWGFDFSDKAPRLVLTKLELEHDEPKTELGKLLDAVRQIEVLSVGQIDQNNGLALSYTKSAEDIVKDYLVGIREQLFKDLRSVYPAAYLSSIPIDLVITVPAGWSDEAKGRTANAFRRAGFDSSHVDFRCLREIIVILEPEAAALHTVRSLTAQEGLDIFRVGDCFILCDAGGGTVDLISYRIKKTQPTLDLQEIGLATGGRSGASFIDREFKMWLQRKLGTHYEKLIDGSSARAIGFHTAVTAAMHHIMVQFEAIKRHFDGKAHGGPFVSSITLPRVLDNVEDDPENGIIDGDIRITENELKVIFDPWIERVLELLQGQEHQVRAAGFPVRDIFLSGGFAESPYLQARVGEFARLRRIRFRLTEDPWLAVVHGAVTKGVEQAIQDSTPKRNCPRHYGVSTSQPFSEFKHFEEDAYIDPYDGEKKAGRQITWLIRKGDTLSTTKPKTGYVEICRKFGVGENRVFSLEVVACEDDDVPQRQADIHAGGVTTVPVTYDLNQFEQNKFEAVRGGANGQPYFCAKLRIEIEMRPNSSVIKVLMDGQVINSVEDNY